MEEESDKSVFSKQQNFSGDTEEAFQGDDLSDPTNKSRRPPNAYILYCLEKRTELRNIHPELPNIEISRMLGQNWKSLEEVARRPYKEKAKILQTEFKKEHPNYKYEKARKKRITQEILMANNKTNTNTNTLGSYNINLNYFSSTLSSLLSQSNAIDGSQNPSAIDFTQILSNPEYLKKCIQQISQKQQAQQKNNQNIQNNQPQIQNIYQNHNTFQQDFSQHEQNVLNELSSEHNPQSDGIIGDNLNYQINNYGLGLNASPISTNTGSSLGLNLNGADAPPFASDFSYLSTDFQPQFD